VKVISLEKLFCTESHHLYGGCHHLNIRQGSRDDFGTWDFVISEVLKETNDNHMPHPFFRAVAQLLLQADKHLPFHQLYPPL